MVHAHIDSKFFSFSDEQKEKLGTLVEYANMPGFISTELFIGTDNLSEVVLKCLHNKSIFAIPIKGAFDKYLGSITENIETGHVVYVKVVMTKPDVPLNDDFIKKYAELNYDVRDIRNVIDESIKNTNNCFYLITFTYDRIGPLAMEMKPIMRHYRAEIGKQRGLIDQQELLNAIGYDLEVITFFKDTGSDSTLYNMMTTLSGLWAKFKGAIFDYRDPGFLKVGVISEKNGVLDSKLKELLNKKQITQEQYDSLIEFIKGLTN